MQVYDISYDAPVPETVGLFPFVLIPELQAQKVDLNKTKSKLDRIDADSTLSKEYVKFSTMMYLYRTLKGELESLPGESGIDPRMKTKAYIKMRELLGFMREWIASFLIDSHFLTLHAAEAPGAFVPALQAFLQDYRLRWEWYAESYIDVYSQKGGYLGDHYGFIAKTKKHWLSGADSDGDITSSANIISFNHFLRSPKRLLLSEEFIGGISGMRGMARTIGGKKVEITKGRKSIKPGLCDLVTSDVKMVPPDNDYNEEENQNYAVHLGQIMLAIKCTKIGGAAFLKFFTFFEAASVCMLWLLTSTFEKVLITKPVTSTNTNSETYVICINRRYDLDKEVERSVFQTLENIRFKRTYDMLFPAERIPKELIDKIVAAETELVRRQKEALEAMLVSFENRDKLNVEELKETQLKLAKAWIVRNCTLPEK